MNVTPGFIMHELNDSPFFSNPNDDRSNVPFYDNKRPIAQKNNNGILATRELINLILIREKEDPDFEKIIYSDNSIRMRFKITKDIYDRFFHNMDIIKSVEYVNSLNVFRSFHILDTKYQEEKNSINEYIIDVSV